MVLGFPSVKNIFNVEVRRVTAHFKPHHTHSHNTDLKQTPHLQNPHAWGATPVRLVQASHSHTLSLFYFLSL